ncbi:MULTISPECIES: CHAP domain-containing protein [Nocardioides]|jgi:surface antigen|uniref:CHAP domain-containing protein n=1 Tax=Nocardioides TaxID=1839 RepID=UPI000A05E0CE|nr:MULTISPECIES: CHAP domain-containing protein [Nocardioides]
MATKKGRTWRRTLTLAFVLTLLTSVTSMAPAPQASAASSYLCKGYAACELAGYSSAGYATAGRTMYWGMYAGHNCTNYVAYRLVQNGMANTRPWSGSGTAYKWGLVNASITDQVPEVGAIAWWNSGAAGVSSSGHLAYVEQVVSPTEIVVSEDSWGGDFSWRSITTDGRGWPTGFIHFIAAPATTPLPPAAPSLASVTPPSVVGEARVGQPLVGDVGQWTGNPTEFAFQWYANGVALPAATSSTYIPSVRKLDATISLTVTAISPGLASASASSAPVGPTAKGTFTVVTPTTVKGQPILGKTLTAAPATFAPAPRRLRFQWRANGKILHGARGATITVGRSLVGKSLAVSTIALSGGRLETKSTSFRLAPVRRAR